ncbi:hypothetical protein ACRPHP_07210 [Pantoea allii]|uniref:hypothetical protein n=1 Tax=Pantoea allii TaxID=574096 RepID=UPI003D7BEAEE
MIEIVKEGGIYFSSSGLRFAVLHKAKHGQDCSIPMIVYTNLEATKDYPMLEKWVISESFFLKTFSEVKPNG